LSEGVTVARIFCDWLISQQAKQIRREEKFDLN
jgi:hypothetical protein